MTLNEARKIAGLPLKEEYDQKKTSAEGMALVKMLKNQFHVEVDYKQNDDGSMTITVNNGSLAPDSQGDNPNVVTAKTLSAAIDKPFREYRQKGWYFGQPTKGAFTIGVK